MEAIEKELFVIGKINELSKTLCGKAMDDSRLKAMTRTALLYRVEAIELACEWASMELSCIDLIPKNLFPLLDRASEQVRRKIEGERVKNSIKIEPPKNDGKYNEQVVSAFIEKWSKVPFYQRKEQWQREFDILSNADAQRVFDTFHKSKKT